MNSDPRFTLCALNYIDFFPSLSLFMKKELERNIHVLSDIISAFGQVKARPPPFQEKSGSLIYYCFSFGVNSSKIG